MSKVETSYLIPSKNEPFLQNTILDILRNSTGEFEVLVNLDGYRPPEEEIVKDDRVTYIYTGGGASMRAGIERCAAIAKGDFFIKADAHVSISPGMNSILRNDCPVNGVMIPERRRLDVVNWKEQYHDPKRKPPVTSEYLSFPDNPADWGGPGLNGKQWLDKMREMQDVEIFDIPASQGSLWGTSRANYERMGGMHEDIFGTFWAESQSTCFSTLLTDEGKDKPIGTYKVNKKCNYKHWHKGSPKDVEFPDGLVRKIGGRGYTLKESALVNGRNANMRFFYAEKVFPNQVRPLSYIINLHPGMPGWTQKRIDELMERERKAGWNV